MRAVGIKKLRLDSSGNVEIECGDPEVTVQVPTNIEPMMSEAERQRRFEEIMFMSAGGPPPDVDMPLRDEGN